MKTKLIICIICITVLITSMCSCNSEKNTPAESTETTVSETTAEKTTTTTTVPATTESQKILDGKKIVVDAGHGCTVDYMEPIAPGLDPTNPEGPGTGTHGVSTGKPEKTLTLEIAKPLRNELIKLGAEVVMIRSKEGTTLSLQQRSEVGNKAEADFSIRIHADGLDDSSVQGASVLYPSSTYVGEDVAQESKVIAQYLSDAYCRTTGLYNRGLIERGDLTGFNFSKIPVVLIELGFMSNEEEDKKMSDKDFQKKMVQGIVNGVLEYYSSK